jgi:hypothetical protein
MNADVRFDAHAAVVAFADESIGSEVETRDAAEAGTLRDRAKAEAEVLSVRGVTFRLGDRLSSGKVYPDRADHAILGHNEPAGSRSTGSIEAGEGTQCSYPC